MNFYSGALAEQQLPEPNDEVLPGVKWGRPEWVPSPAFWVALANTWPSNNSLFRKPDSLAEEVGFCLLGGYGITAEVNCAAFLHLKENGVFEGNPVNADDLRTLLKMPLKVHGSLAKYRFPNQRSVRLASALQRLTTGVPLGVNSRDLRSFLLTFEGIGPKTASWIVRNWMDADDVAIIDIHVHRAGLWMGLFSRASVLPRDYFEMETRFLLFAEKISVRASVLDALIWCNMRTLGATRRSIEV